MDIKARLHFRPVRQLADATHVKVVPHSFVGTKGIVPLHGKATVGCGEPGQGERRVTGQSVVDYSTVLALLRNAGWHVRHSREWLSSSHGRRKPDALTAAVCC